MAFCYDDYISISPAYRISRSGLYADQLPGISEDLIDNLARDPEDDSDTIWPVLVKRAWDNMVSDISMNVQQKFFVDLKLVSRETSQFKSEANINSGASGIKIQFDLPRYAKIHVVRLEVMSEVDYGSPGITFKFYDTDISGDPIYEVSDSVSVGKSVINIDKDFEVDNLLITYEPTEAQFKQTENKHYRTGIYDPIICDVCLDPYNGLYRGTVEQINGGGINAFYNVRCSVEKFVCENINLFRQSFLYRIGLEITQERRLGERLTRYTTMTVDRANELLDAYNTEYNIKLQNALKSQNMAEDPVCFTCKNTSYVATSLP